MAIAERHAPRANGSAIDLTTTEPGTPGGIFMRGFWHPIARGVDLAPGHAIPVRVMSEDYTLFRGASGRAQLVAQRCPHRGALMHLGWVENDDIRCVYHGWKYDCSGQCVEAPAEKEGFAKNVRIATFPTGEAFGMIYGYFGPDEPPQFPPYPESHGEGMIEAWPVEHVPCNYLQSFENTMDEVHVAFTHAPGGSHAALARDLPLITAEETPWGMLRFGKRASGMVRHTLHYAPNIVRVIVPPLAGMDGVGGWPEITFHFTPVDDENHLWFVSAKVQVTGSDVELYMKKRAEFYAARAAAPPVNRVVEDIWSGKIAYADVRHPELAIVQDIAVQAGQGKTTNRDAETLGRSDAGLALWRRILERELRIIAAGGTPKKWQRPPEDVIPVVGIPGQG
jgi:5,5'-dehydrodivanillate O-demethylase oxygenase subunit